ncbi:MAG: hypothetical protein HQ517_02480 [SAR324 cluster bacterium]|nr:hypothetical protein [SAR324 cluster bacterium]
MLANSFMPLMVGLGWLSLLLLLGVVLRAKVGFLQKYLFPASLIGGVFGFIIINVGWTSLDHTVFTLIAYHLFSLGFISIGLTGTDSIGSSPKKIFRGGLWLAIIFIFSICIQGILGIAVLSVFNRFMEPIYLGIGSLVGSGFAQGPGQVVALAVTWESTYKIPHAVSIGLTFAAFGFLIAALIGVPLANWGVRKGLTVSAPKDLPREFTVGIFEAGQGTEAGHQTTHPANIDTFAFQLSLVFGTYFLTYLECSYLYTILPKVLQAMTFGFAFFYGLVNALLIRLIMKKLKLDHLIDNNVQRRITGTSVDFMIVATLMAVKLTVVLAYIVPIITISAVVTIATFSYVLYLGRRCGVEDYSFERTLAIFGTMTGTVASGLLLLRIVDPDFKSPIATELGICGMMGLIFGLHIAFFTYPQPEIGIQKWLIVVAITAVVMLTFLKVFKLWKKKAW